MMSFECRAVLAEARIRAVSVELDDIGSLRAGDARFQSTHSWTESVWRAALRHILLVGPGRPKKLLLTVRGRGCRRSDERVGGDRRL